MVMVGVVEVVVVCGVKWLWWCGDGDGRSGGASDGGEDSL